MPAIECPRCFTELEYTGEWWTGIACECENCKGILADNDWLESNLIQEDYHRLRARVFRGSPGEIFCPYCLSVRPRRPIGMTKFTVSPGGKSYEIDGCQKCGSMWFDHGELVPYEEGGDDEPSVDGASKKKDSGGDLDALDASIHLLDMLFNIFLSF